MIVKKREKMDENFLKESKSQLARLMATENLQIEHQKISTAKFDVKNRVLYLPIWTDMQGFIYDLLCGHEVGHALFTPEEGWHDAVVDKSKGKNYKNFLNVIEDARIEKRIQRKYPGLKLSFKKAYAKLMNEDFFGIGKRKINSFPFIDRLNIFTKSQYTALVDFNADEYKMLEKVKSAETWQDVVDVADEIYNYSKIEQLDYESELDSYDYNFGESDDESYMDDLDLDLNENTIEPDGDSNEDEDEDKGEDGDEGEDTPSSSNSSSKEGDEEGYGINRNKEDRSDIFDQEFAPNCQTDENYRNNESKLIDEECKPYRYLNLPKINFNNIFTPAKRVQEMLTEDFNKQIEETWFTKESVEKYYSEFKRKNDKYISLLAKEFEMKKAAKVFSKKKVSNTGDLDINKLASYKFDDNIFKKAMIFPKGKSHGLILLLDYSGSMYDNLPGSIEQILILAGFCRKVNIPFSVMTFSNDESVWAEDRKKTNYEMVESDLCFEKKENNLKFGLVQLREYLNSDMNNTEYTHSVKNMILLKHAWSNRRNWRTYEEDNVRVPSFERLTNTPLTQAIYALGDYTNAFKKKKNIDIVNLVVVHDGDSDNISTYWTFGFNPWPKRGEENKQMFYPANMTLANENFIIKDKKINFELKYNNNWDCTFRAVVEWYKKYTGSKIIGFYIVEPSGKNVRDAIQRQYYDKNNKTIEKWEQYKEIQRIFRKEKLLISKKPTYDDFYLILGGKDLTVNDAQIEVDGKITANKLKNAFMKVNKTKQINRVLVSKFIEKIAA